MNTLKLFLNDKKLLFLLFLALIVKLFSLNEEIVETYYTYGLYPYLARFYRVLFGWIPFSIGDLLYIAAAIYLLAKVRKFIRLLRNRMEKKYLLLVITRKLLRLFLYVYLLFNINWGLNYNRIGIAHQLQLEVKKYNVEDLDTLTAVLQSRINQLSPQINASEREKLQKRKYLLQEGVAAYKAADDDMPFLTYQTPSVKSSLFSPIGHFFGFSGYYNPVSGEAQINTSIPVFLKPFVITHEIGHQLGFAKENEANLVAFFAGRKSANPEFRYSVYFEMFLYANGELRRRDSTRAAFYREGLHPQAKQDINALSDYLQKSANRMEPLVDAFYDAFLKWNNQPKGKMTYNAVVSWLVAYQKKYGKEAI